MTVGLQPGGHHPALCMDFSGSWRFQQAKVDAGLPLGIMPGVAYVEALASVNRFTFVSDCASPARRRAGSWSRRVRPARSTKASAAPFAVHPEEEPEGRGRRHAGRGEGTRSHDCGVGRVRRRAHAGGQGDPSRQPREEAEVLDANIPDSRGTRGTRSSHPRIPKPIASRSSFPKLRTRRLTSAWPPR